MRQGKTPFESNLSTCVTYTSHPHKITLYKTIVLHITNLHSYVGQDILQHIAKHTELMLHLPIMATNG